MSEAFTKAECSLGPTIWPDVESICVNCLTNITSIEVPGTDYALWTHKTTGAIPCFPIASAMFDLSKVLLT